MPLITNQSHTLVHLTRRVKQSWYRRREKESAVVAELVDCTPEPEPTATPYPKPLTTISEPGNVTLEQMANRVIDTRVKHGETLQKYHEIWYESGHTWVYTHFLGIGMMKSPNDLWAYHDILVQHRPQTIIEAGTYQGGSALWFAFLMDMLQIEGGKVLTIDIEDRRLCDHPRISFLAGSSVDPDLAAAVISEVQGPLLVVLDSDHAEAHVRAELELYAPACKVGDWLVVEDTNISWTDTKIQIGDRIECSGGDRGARGGLESYLLDHPGEFRQDVLSERFLLSMSPGGFLQRMAVCSHG